MTQTADFTQWSTLSRLVTSADGPAWVPEEEKLRIAAYNKYEQIYWNDDRSFQLMRRGTELQPILIPNPRTICDTTSYYLLKDVVVSFKNGTAQTALESFLTREKFASKFAVAKHSGVVRGDYVFHITVDEGAEEGSRVCINSIDPGCYFPHYDPDDLDRIDAVDLAEYFRDDDNEWRIKKRTYRLVEGPQKERRVSVKEAVYENDTRWAGAGIGTVRQPRINRVLQPEGLLPPEIQNIPVYHFKNMDWQGQPYGSSELRGLERVLASVDQTISDGELALALEGLGVYATDAGPPQDDNGQEQAWEIYPAKVLEIPTGSSFKRVDGIKSYDPVLNHIKYLEERLWESSSTFLAGTIDVQVAQSGIALAIRFLPMQAKIGERDLHGRDSMGEMFTDWTTWEEAYEGANFGGEVPVIELGDKLPLNREGRVAELNNMLDRQVISRKYYRKEMSKLGYTFDDDMESQIKEEMQWLAEYAIKGGIEGEPQADPANPGFDMQGNPMPSGNPSNPNAGTKGPKPNGSNNRNGKSNESDGTETGQSLRSQQKTR